MGNFSSFDISSMGLLAQRVRMDAIANNIANAETTRTADGGPYRRQRVVFSLSPEADMVTGASPSAPVASVEEDESSPRMIHDPGHPDANRDGYVALPNVSIAEEMVDMISATRSYEANIAAITAGKTMSTAALELGRG